MPRLTFRFATIAVTFLLIAQNAHADLKTLMEIGKNQEIMAKALKDETKNYNRVKEAILGEKLKEGISSAEIKKRYGEPIIDIFDEKRNVYKWLYMPETSTHFEGEKIYLYVDEEGVLVGWQLIEK
ncbi:MAG: hypothetical protein JW800_07880 [Candidatus Omnitrophica bacterium]|nr:hypothetical protein [Candidatus Omnitrophota bacterium]